MILTFFPQRYVRSFPGGNGILLPVWDSPFFCLAIEPTTPSPNQNWRGSPRKSPDIKTPGRPWKAVMEKWGVFSFNWGSGAACYTHRKNEHDSVEHPLIWRCNFPIETWGMFFPCHVDVFRVCKFAGNSWNEEKSWYDLLDPWKSRLLKREGLLGGYHDIQQAVSQQTVDFSAIWRCQILVPCGKGPTHQRLQ